MTALYDAAILVHVLTAVLGVGQIAAIAVVSAVARRAGEAAPSTAASLGQLARGATWSLVVMLVTGALLDFALGRAFDRAWWFRGSVLLLVVLGFLLGRTRRALRKPDAQVLAVVQRGAVAMCAVVAAIVALMVIKPG
jgi:hypothetical protein